MLALILCLLHPVIGRMNIDQSSTFNIQLISTSDLLNLFTSVSSSQTNQCIDALISLITNKEASGSFVDLLLKSGKRANDLGNYRGCKGSEHSHYILMGVRFSNTDFVRIGVCLPKKCTITELSKLKEQAAYLLGKTTNREITKEHIYLETFNEAASVSAGFSLTWTFVGLFMLIIITATIIDINGYCTKERIEQSKLLKLVSCFSFPKNLNNFLTAANPFDKNLEIFKGISFFLMAWVILTNTYVEEFLSPAYNRVEWFQMILHQFKFAFIKSGTVALDAFFMISGFFAACSLYLVLSEEKARTLKTILVCYLYKFLKLLPIIVCTILFMVFIAPSIKNFALNPYLKDIPETCSKTWILTLLFLGNFQGYDNICIDWSWVLMNDMQFYLLAPFLVLPFFRSKRLGSIILLVVGIISIIVTIAIYASYGLHMSYAKEFNNDYYTVFYIRPYCRIVPYLMGIFFYMAYRDAKSEEPTLKKFNAFIGKGGQYLLYGIGLVLMFLSLILIHFFDNNPNSWGTGLATLHELTFRPLFVLGLMLLLYPSLIGHGQFLGSIFGHPVLNPFGKLTYSAYMTHFIVLYLILVYGEVGHFTTETYIFFSFFTIMSITYPLSFFISMLVEAPVTQILRGFVKRYEEQIEIEEHNTTEEGDKEVFLTKEDREQ